MRIPSVANKDLSQINFGFFLTSAATAAFAICSLQATPQGVHFMWGLTAVCGLLPLFFVFQFFRYVALPQPYLEFQSNSVHTGVPVEGTLYFLKPFITKYPARLDLVARRITKYSFSVGTVNPNAVYGFGQLTSGSTKNVEVEELNRSTYILNENDAHQENSRLVFPITFVAPVASPLASSSPARSVVVWSLELINPRGFVVVNFRPIPFFS